MANLLDLMKPEDRARVEDAYKKRMNGDLSYRKGMHIPPEIHLVAELGCLYGWGAIEAAKRGYVEAFEVKHVSGERVERRTKIPLTLEEISVLVEAGRKVRYSAVVDDARATQAGVSSAMSKKPNRVFQQSMKEYINRAKRS